MNARGKSRPRGGKKQSRRKHAAERYDVGYGNPPREHQFKPGQSGNKSGRPRGTKNEATILQELLSKMINMREGERIKRITILEAMFRRFVEDSLKGNTKTATFLLSRLSATNSEGAATDISEDDQAVLDAYLQKIQPKSKSEE